MILSIGLMSGTSMDGIDAAILATDGTPQVLHLGAHVALSYDPEFRILLRSAEYALQQCDGDLAAAHCYYPQAILDYLAHTLHSDAVYDYHARLMAYLHHAQFTDTLDSIIKFSTWLHGKAVEQLLAQSSYTARDIAVIGYHGQTLYHQPERNISIIVGDGQELANQTKIKVITDFRSNDILHGGQGAPLAPIYHQALAIKHNMLPLAVINCGGIANVTFIPNDDPLQLLGFDTGAGNGLLDRLVRQRTGNQEHMDADGKYASAGTVNAAALTALYQTAVQKNDVNYFTLTPPKALDINDLQLIPELAKLSLADACATLAAFTADSIVQQMQKFVANMPEQWVLAGGGWCNPVILRELRERAQRQLGAITIIRAAAPTPTAIQQPGVQIDWNGAALEAQLFAYLAVRSMHQLPLSFPGTTGVQQPLSGGCMYHPLPV